MPNLITAAASLFLWTFSKFGINEARAILLQNDSAYKTFERTILGLANIVIALLFPILLLTFGAILLLLNEPLEYKILAAVFLFFMVSETILPKKWLNTIANVVVPSRFRIQA